MPPLYFKVRNNDHSPPLKDALKAMLYSPKLLKELDDHNDRILQDSCFKVENPVTKWLRFPNPGCAWRARGSDREDSNQLPRVTLASDFGSIVQNVIHNRCSIVVAPTGSGKSVLAPIVAHESSYSLLPRVSIPYDLDVDYFRGLHIVPTAEQASQIAPFVETHSDRRMLVGYYTEGVADNGRNIQLFHENSYNYVFTTHFFGVEALESECYFNTVVLDEVHVLTPQLVYILYLARQKINNGQINRLILLSASLSESMTHDLIEYFDPTRTNIVNYLECPHEIETLQFCQSTDSIDAAQYTELPRSSDEDYYSREVCVNGNPNAELMRKRTVHHAISIIKKMVNSGQCSTANVPFKHGIVCFLPNPADVMHAIRDFFVFTQSNRTFGAMFRCIRGFTIYGIPRVDIQILKENAFPQLIRVVFTTDKLCNGITLPRINHVVDSGLVSIPNHHTLRGIECYAVEWADSFTREQRKGTVGRFNRGYYHEVFSNKRSDEIFLSKEMKNLNLLRIMTADMVNVLIVKDDSFCTMNIGEKFDSLMLLAGIQGFLEFHEKTTEERSNLNPMIEPLGKALARSFVDLPLEYGLFLATCASNRVLLSGTLFLASLLGSHAAIKNPSSRHDRFGRNSSTSLLNSWKRITSSNSKSDIEIFTEVITNLWMVKIGIDDDSNQWIPQLRIPPSALDKNNFNEDGILELNRRFHSLMNQMISASMIVDHSDIYSSQVSSVELKPCGYNDQFCIVQLSEEGRRAFSMCLISAFGSRLLARGSYADQQLASSGRTMYRMVNLDLPDQRNEQLVQGEIQNTASNFLAVYPTLIKRNGREDYITSLIHQCDNLAFLTHANVHGSRNDSCDLDNLTLTIHALNATVVYCFDDKETLQVVSDYRRTLRVMPTVGRNRELSSAIFELSQFNFSRYLTVFETQSRLPVSSILHWKNCAGVGTDPHHLPA